MMARPRIDRPAALRAECTAANGYINGSNRTNSNDTGKSRAIRK
ncbi:MAG TPA: hypothetical protein VGK48_00790 [Terriglobia bacterium]